ncbi:MULTISPECIES: hypothetical protein [Eggerthella]|uniref:hypothetical protein n=1 Tax=Eggerthella TaxID=84111 RepID=UPI002598EE0B|nr:hypothetical protein [Eggerthella sp.]MDR3847366.1 hypothetical protein [Eggerthella sp.]
MNAARRIVRAICVFNGVCAVVCGGFMMTGAAGILPPAFDELFGFFDLMVPLIQRMPLPAYMTADLFWPGLALALVNGVANLVAAVLFARSDGRARSWALLGGALLIVWCVFELVYLPNPVSVIYLVIGLVQTACAVVMRPAR